MMTIDYASKSYFKQKTHNTTAEEFVMAVPSSLSKQTHRAVMRQVASPTNDFFTK